MKASKLKCCVLGEIYLPKSRLGPGWGLFSIAQPPTAGPRGEQRGAGLLAPGGERGLALLPSAAPCTARPGTSRPGTPPHIAAQHTTARHSTAYQATQHRTTPWPSTPHPPPPQHHPIQTPAPLQHRHKLLTYLY